MRTILAIRHAHSTANGEKVPAGLSADDLAFANQSAGLTQRGVEECARLAPTLRTRGIDPHRVDVAVTEYARTRQTAERLGFPKARIMVRPEINEVDHGMDLDVLRAMLRRNEVPRVAVMAAERLLRTPPKENVWVTHGLLIAGMCIVLGTADGYERPVPRQCEVRRLTF